MKEIFGPRSDRLVPPADAATCARIAVIANDPAAARNEVLTLRARVQAGFSADTMTDAVLAAYREAL